MNRLQRHAGAFFLLLASATAAVAEPGITWQLSARYNRHSDFGALKDIDSEDASRFSTRGHRNVAYLDEEVRLARGADPWNVALLARSTATLTATDDTIAAWRHTRRLDRDGTDRSWDIEGRLRGFTGAGVEVARSFELAPGWEALVSAQALMLARWRDRRLDGTADFDAATGRYGFNLRSWEVNDHRTFPFFRSFSAHGAGLLFGGELRWRREDLTLGLNLRDLGVLYWDGIPQQEMSINSSTRSVDAQGFVVYQPLLQGRNTQKSTLRGAPVRGGASARWQASAADELVLSGEFVRDYGVLPTLAWERSWAAGVRTELAWQVHERRLVVGAEWKGLRVRFGADRFGEGTQSRMVEASYRYAFD